MTDLDKAHALSEAMDAMTRAGADAHASVVADLLLQICRKIAEAEAVEIHLTM
jgi:hypothetical protein